MLLLVAAPICLQLLGLGNVASVTSARRSSFAPDRHKRRVFHDAFGGNLRHERAPRHGHGFINSPRRLEDKNTLPFRSMRRNSSPPEASRDDNRFCYVGNYHTPPLRQAEGSTEPLLDPPKLVPDPYGWMRDDTRENTTVLDHLTRENEYTQEATAHLEDLRQEIFDEMVGRIQEIDFTAPYLQQEDGQYVYYSRTFEGSGYVKYCRAPIPDDILLKDGEITADLIDWDGKADTPILMGEEVYLDANEVAEGHEFSDIGSLSISPSERYAAYTVDNLGNEEFTLVIKDMMTGNIVRDYGTDSGPGLVSFKILWGNDDSTLFYLKDDDEWRTYQVYALRVDLSQESGGIAAHDITRLLFEEPNQIYWVWIMKSNDEKYLFIQAYSSETQTTMYIDLEKWTLQEDEDESLPNLPMVAKRREGVYYEVEHYRGHWLIVSNEDGNGNRTPNDRLSISPAVPNSENLWRSLQDEDGQILFDGSKGDKSLLRYPPPISFDNHIVLQGRGDGLPRIWVLEVMLSNQQIDSSPSITLSVIKSNMLTFKEDAYEAYVTTNLYNTSRVRVDYSSLTTPSQIMSIDMNTNDVASAIIVKKDNVVNYDKSLYVTHRTFVTSRDGETQIPVSMVFRSDIVGPITEDDMPNDVPVSLYGYGSYGSSLELSFSTYLLSLLDRGVVYVQAHVRGGGEMGLDWYESAKYLNKKRTFDDFVDVAKWLIGQDGEGKGKITSPEKLAIDGASAGGLLVGAAMNQAPEIFRVAILEVPFLDVVCTMSDASIPLTVGEWEEWGNPNEVKYFDYIMSYSPMNNIRTGATYPSTLILGGLYDSRVAYWEPAKFAAMLRHEVGQYYDKKQMRERPILLKTNLAGGHAYASDRYKKSKEIAYMYSFMLDQLGFVELKVKADIQEVTNNEMETSSGNTFGWYFSLLMVPYVVAIAGML